MGQFIVFEGIDGSGTTTISKEVAKRIGAVWMCEPTDGEIGRFLRRALKGEVGPFHSATLLNLFQADRIEHTIEIKKMLAAGETIVCDRYFVSTAVYQSLRDDFETSRLVLKDICHRLFYIEYDYLLIPDVDFFLDVSVHVSRERRGLRGGEAEIFDDDDKQAMLRRLYLDYFRRYRNNYVHVDAEKSEDHCIEMCLSHLQRNT